MSDNGHVRSVLVQFYMAASEPMLGRALALQLPPMKNKNGFDDLENPEA